jgi:hypothetical protein
MGVLCGKVMWTVLRVLIIMVTPTAVNSGVEEPRVGVALNVYN